MTLLRAISQGLKEVFHIYELFEDWANGTPIGFVLLWMLGIPMAVLISTVVLSIFTSLSWVEVLVAWLSSLFLSLAIYVGRYLLARYMYKRVQRKLAQ